MIQNKDDVGKFLLRISLGLLMLSHGLSKMFHGIDGIKGLVLSKGLPEMLAYGVYLGEVIAPICLVIGLKVRLSSLVMSMTMVMAIALAHSHEIFQLSKHGSPVIELPLLYLLCGLALLSLGGGKILSPDHYFSKRKKKIF